jgi:hypothetical protein
MKTHLTKSIFLFLMLFLAVPLISHGQSFSDEQRQTVQLDMSPENPQPLQNVTFRVTSYLSDLDHATITWFENGRNVASGVGMRAYSTTVGAVGMKKTIEVKIVTADGVTITQAIPLMSASVDLIWEAESYTPPFYKGKALLASYETVKIVAVPHLGKSSTSLSPTNLIYTWSKDGRVLGSLSGYGRNILTLKPQETLRPATIKVTVTNADGSLNAVGQTIIQPKQPKLIAYMYSPAYGTLYNYGFQGSFKLPTKELNVIAIPYFFDVNQSTVQYVNYTWKMNNTTLESALQNILTLRNDATTTGTSNISVTASVPAGNSTQQQSTAFTITF